MWLWEKYLWKKAENLFSCKGSKRPSWCEAFKAEFWIWSDDGLFNRWRRVSVCPVATDSAVSGKWEIGLRHTRSGRNRGMLFRLPAFSSFIKAFSKGCISLCMRQKLIRKNKGSHSIAVGSRVGNKILGVKLMNQSSLPSSLFVSLLQPFPPSLPSFLVLFSKGPLWIRAKLPFHPLVFFCPLDSSEVY